MTVALLAAVTYTFTAVATGVEKGTTIEFPFAIQGSDRDYESLFLLEGTAAAFCDGFEKAGMPRGKPEDASACRFWPCGASVTFKPDLTEFLSGKIPSDLPSAGLVYTGGDRLGDGTPVCDTNMPAAFFSIYSLSQAPIVFDGHYEQGMMYGNFVAAKTLKKGTRFTFTVIGEPKTMPRALSVVAEPGKGADLLQSLRALSASNALDVTVSFSPALSVREATAIAHSLEAVDSRQIKINGKDNLFYRAFLPNPKWLDRQQRLPQPFELSVGATNTLVFIDEDWSVEGPDPKLTPQIIPPADVTKHPKTDTCFVFARPETTLRDIFRAMDLLKAGRIRNWYVFGQEKP